MNDQQISMTETQLTWGMIWEIIRRMIAWGVGLGALLAAAYIVALVLVTWSWSGAGPGCMVASVIGAVAGFILGAVEGLVMSFLTVIAFLRSVRDTQKYKLAMLLTAAGIPLALVILVILYYGLASLSSFEVGIYLTPLIIAAFASGYAGWRVAGWVMDEWVGSPLTKE